MSLPRYVVAFYHTADGEGWAVADTHEGRRVSVPYEQADNAACICKMMNDEPPELRLARIAIGIGSSPSPDQLTRLHAAAREVLEKAGKP